MKKSLLVFMAAAITYLGAQEPITFIFCHGLGGNWQQALFYAKNNSYNGYSLINPINWHIMQEPMHAFNFPHASDQGGIKRDQVSLAQHIEITTLEKECARINTGKVLVGVSMGAATIINYVSKNPATIKALVLESPFDRPESIVGFQVEQNSPSWFASSSLAVGKYAMNWYYPQYNAKGINPSQVIAKINKNIPVFIVHSKKDGLIPVKSSRHLYAKLKKAGHQHVYLLELEDGAHANCCTGKDALKYQQAVHAFYKKYGIPCDESLAASGQAILKTCQPTLKEMAKRK